MSAMLSPLHCTGPPRRGIAAKREAAWVLGCVHGAAWSIRSTLNGCGYLRQIRVLALRAPESRALSCLACQALGEERLGLARVSTGQPSNDLLDI